MVIPVCIANGTSTACSASALRGRPKKAIPKTFTKHAAANPPIRARTPTISGSTICALVFVRTEPARKLRKVSHSLMKPLKSGNPTIEQQAIRKVAPVAGIRRCNPPSSSKSIVWVASEIALAPRNSRLLNKA